MDPKFLREEAARFRGMAETQERESSKQRYLAMAADYEAKADAADGVTQPSSAETTSPKTAKKVAKENEETV